MYTKNKLAQAILSIFFITIFLILSSTLPAAIIKKPNPDTPYLSPLSSRNESLEKMNATILYVDDDYDASTQGWGITCFKTIPTAEDAASNGDTIFVYNGTYNHGYFTTAKQLDFIGENIQNVQVNYIELYGIGCLIQSFTFIISGAFSGVFLEGATNIHITDCRFIGTSIKSNEGTDIIIKNCSFSGFPGTNPIQAAVSFMLTDDAGSNNIITDCDFSDNNCGIYFDENSHGNIVYHNNFINNTWSAYDAGGNTWDKGISSGGNYWSDYTGFDSDGDGKGDEPYPVNGGNSVDNYPFMHEHGWTDECIDWWPMCGHDLCHTGHSTTDAPNMCNLLWSFSTNAKLRAHPIIVNDRVYIGTYDNKMYCLDSHTGSKIWEYNTGGTIYASAAALLDGLLYIGSGNPNGKMSCLNAVTGSLVWDYFVGGGSVTSSPAVENHKVFFGAYDKNIYCLNADNGSLLWKYPTGNHIVFSSPAVYNGMVFIGSNDQHLYCLNQSNGIPVWISPTLNGMVCSSPAIADGKVYVGDFGGMIWCFNASDGNPLWHVFSGGSINTASIALSNDRVIIGCSIHPDGTIFCLNSTDGVLIWSFETNGYVESTPAIADGKVYIGSNDNHVYCLNEENGSLLWNYDTTSAVWSSPAITNGRVYVGSENGKVYCFGTLHQDIGICSIDAPMNGPARILKPAVTIKNFGTENLTNVPISFQISEKENGNVEYNKTIVLSIKSGETINAIFSEWIPDYLQYGQSGTVEYILNVQSHLVNDEKTSNDQLVKTITVEYVHDFGVKEISKPVQSSILLSENFDGTWESDPDGDMYMVPLGWNINGICTHGNSGQPSLTHYWSRFDDSIYSLPNSLPYFAGVWWNDHNGGEYNGQNEWIVSPEINASKYTCIQLTFHSVYAMKNYGTSSNVHNYVKISTDRGESWAIVADLCHDDAYYFPELGDQINMNKIPIVVDLSSYDNCDSLIIAWQYYVHWQAEKYAAWMIDDVILDGFKFEALSVDSYPVEAIIKNYGSFTEKNFNVTAVIYKGIDGEEIFYEDTAVITTELASNESVLVQFNTVSFEEDTDEGLYRMKVSTNLAGDEVEENNNRSLLFSIGTVDTVPPETTCILDGEMDEDVYISDVTVTLGATDDFSGVNVTRYRVDGSTWQEYDSSFIIHDEGLHTIIYYSIDHAGNIEDEQSTSFSIEKNVPVLEIIKIKGGFGKVRIVVKNIGTGDASDINYSIKVTGGFLRQINVTTEGNVVSIASGESKTILSDKRIFGFGKIAITIEMTYVESFERTGFVFGPFVMINS